jgi:AraC-like DNA-binding protein
LCSDFFSCLSAPLNIEASWRNVNIFGKIQPGFVTVIFMNSIVLTKAQQFWPLTDYLGSFGVPVGRYIEQFRLPGKMLDAPELFIDEVRFWRLAQSLAEREGFLDWGFRAGQQMDLSVLGEFGTTLLQQPSLKVALETFVIAISAETLQTQFCLKQQGEYFWLIMQGHHGAPKGRSIIELYDLQFFLTLVQCAVGKNWRPPAVHLQCDSLPEGISRNEICTGDIRFSSTMTAIAIPEVLMAEPMRNYCFFKTLNSATQPNDLKQTDFKTSLRLLLAGYLDEGLTINDCANLLGMSSRTLQRRLAYHETTFNEVLDQTRFDSAKLFLQDKSISISDICYELGYENPANFTRAFRRWAGVTPRQHRQLISQPS